MDNPLVIGTVFDSLLSDNNKCGHRLLLSPLTQYLDGSHPSKRGSTCPVCEAPIILVTDALSAAADVNDCDNNDNNNKVFFKYGKQYFRLTVVSDARSWFFNPKMFAQQRIANVFHMEGLKILCKGKVVYPDLTRTEEQISQRLLEISAADKSKKASLVVMGTRVGQGLQRQQTSGIFSYVFNAMFCLVYGSLQWAYQLVFRPPALPPPPEHQD